MLCDGGGVGAACDPVSTVLRYLDGEDVGDGAGGRADRVTCPGLLVVHRRTCSPIDTLCFCSLGDTTASEDSYMPESLNLTHERVPSHLVCIVYL